MMCDVVIDGVKLTPNPVYVEDSIQIEVILSDAVFVISDAEDALEIEDGELLLAPNEDFTVLETENENEIIDTGGGELLELI